MTESIYRDDFDEHFTYATKTNKLAIASLILAALAIAGLVFGGSAGLAAFAVGAGHVALNQIKSREESGALLAHTALVISYAIALYALGSAIYFGIKVA